MASAWQPSFRVEVSCMLHLSHLLLPGCQLHKCEQVAEPLGETPAAICCGPLAEPSCVVLQVKEGKAKAHGSGYGGSGFKFNDQEEEAVKARKKVGQADICSVSPGCTACQRSVCGFHLGLLACHPA